jgi:hypothetical protein
MNDDPFADEIEEIEKIEIEEGVEGNCAETKVEGFAVTEKRTEALGEALRGGRVRNRVLSHGGGVDRKRRMGPNGSLRNVDLHGLQNMSVKKNSTLLLVKYR